MILNDKYFLKRTFVEAKKAKGFHLPNPRVGALIVIDKKIVAKGFHQTFGQNHAEVNAINNALKKQVDLSKATLYISLSPCTKYNKTAPCVQKIINSKIKRVVYAINDPSDSDAKKILQKANIEVVDNLLVNEAKEIIRPFLKNLNFQKPYVVAKLAMTLDGMIATENYDSKWITSQKTKNFSDLRRSNQQAILVGSNTIFMDDPLLNVRKKGYKSPIVVIIDNKKQLKPTFRVFVKNNVKKIVFTNQNYKQENFPNTKFIKVAEKVISTNFILKTLFKMNIKSLLIEGGSYTFNRFLKDDNIDYLEMYIAPKVTGDIKSIHGFNFQKITQINNSLNFEIKNLKKVDSDIFIEMEKKCLPEL